MRKKKGVREYMRATETEGNGGSNKEHEVERKKERKQNVVVVSVHLRADVFICMRISVRRVFVRECMHASSFVNACMRHHHHKRGRRRESGNTCGRQK